MNASIYRLKVSLRRIRPGIWRRLEVPSDLSLWQVHRVLQAAMGWTDYHLHEFQRRGVHYGQSDREYGFHRENERRVLLREVLVAPKDRMIYEYDFGDSWEHDVVLERVTAPLPGIRYPRVLAGERACPPEDVGGTAGYAQFVEAITDPEHPEYQEYRDWAGSRTDPEAFDLSATDAEVRSRVRPRRTGP